MTDDFPRPHPVLFMGSGLARRVLGWFGWQVLADGLPARQGIVIVYPHTSNWDFVVLLLAKWALGFSVKFWIKDTLFRIPLLGTWLRWLGGVAVNRRAAHGIVGSMVDTLKQNQAQDSFFWLALTPEGTRKWTPGWRSGFYQVARGANVPMGLCAIDYATKTVDVTRFYKLSGDVDADMQSIAQALSGTVGYHPESAAPIRIEGK